MTATATATATTAIVIRHANGDDHPLLADLAILDSRPQLTGPALIAEVAGVPRAALDLRDGAVIADPFFPAADLVELLRAHAKRIAPRARVRDSVWSRLATWGAATGSRAGA